MRCVCIYRAFLFWYSLSLHKVVLGQTSGTKYSLLAERSNAGKARKIKISSQMNTSLALITPFPKLTPALISTLFQIVTLTSKQITPVFFKAIPQKIAPMDLTHFKPMFHFYTPYTPCKNQKTELELWISDSFVLFCFVFLCGGKRERRGVGGMEMKHWLEMS